MSKVKKLIILATPLFLSIFFIARNYINNARAQVADVSIYYDGPATFDSLGASYKIVVNSGINNIGFVKLTAKFDQTKINLAGNPQVSNLFKNQIVLTNAGEANSTGSVSIDLGVSPADKDNPPSGTFEIATLNFVPVSVDSFQTTLTFDNLGFQIVDMNASELTTMSSDSIISVNPISPTPTPTAVPTSTPTVTSTPTPIITPTPGSYVNGTAILTLVGPDSPFIFIDDTFNVNLNLATSEPLAGVDAVIKYDQNKIQILEITDDELLSDKTISTFDNVTGTLRISQTQSTGSGYLGSGDMIGITFKAIGLGTTSLDFDFQSDSKTESNAISYVNGNDVLSQPNSLNLNIVNHASVRLALTTDADTNLGNGHDVAGTLYTTNNNFTTGFQTNELGFAGSWQIDDSLIGESATFYVKVLGYLRRKVVVNIVSGNNLIDAGKLVSGDMNNDSVINNIDLSLLYDNWFKPGNGDYNKDDIVNSYDYWLLTSNFFKIDE
ncbi:hypothetical protein A3D00_03915 [Candidatus Woesebacteria bacterium RIFCSPHIGHO2_02_FULL_38_9]|uniref:Cohesin domain-containing protein n=1 Tax=Candidatus Woesebacteria bacterium RIFCSPHIGHO2_01_FULL_39_28 TaxID=1802496 RepID=A0A1F7YL51_9BACT|nr:MAG: hypothetical protein A2627_03230 [Candidatus Woesebacteria bacterium RIFCSPHIGHO2_01_FULL_39_28]OGM31812.1 MAG: hypothetical protein A3D00_03915 [Candidatus Woesebacteria bacterium RIFCSPHIGHO2_02_FULL_38_9]OGM56943.1 MAG: hypothetical protein A3A50_03575 [Candidatus Woesebacteria bacterium RIFCSPLOWO2_01_FULL_38_20]